MTYNILDQSVIGLYFIVLLGIGYYAGKRIKVSEDYSLAGRKLGYPLMIGTLLGTTIGAAATIGTAGKAYEVGIVIFFATIAWGIGLIAFAFITPTIRKIGIVTIPDALAIRFGNGIRIVSAMVMVLAVIALFGGQLIAVGVTVVSVSGEFGITYTEAILGAGMITLLYTLSGGLLAVAYTDLIQTLIMLVFIGFLLPLFVIKDLGGITTALIVLKPAEGSFSGEVSIVYIISLFLIQIPFCLIDPSLWQRAIAAKNSSVIKKSVLVSSGVYFYWSFVMVFLGIAAIHLFPGLNETVSGIDSVIPLEVNKYMPPVLKGFCFAAIIGIVMSTADTALLIAGTTFSWDIIKAFYPQTKDNTLLFISRAFIFAVGILGILFAIYMKGIFEILLLAFAIFVSGIFVPIMAALFWKKATKAGALVSSIASSLTVIVLYGFKISNMLPKWVEPIIVSLAISYILMAIVSIATFKSDQATSRLIDKR